MNSEQPEFDIRQEADYVLGMMEMYESDDEIAGILKTKGLTPIQINEVLSLVRMEGYKKRLRQAKRIMLIGAGIVVLALIPYVIWWDQIDSITTDRDAIGRTYGKAIIGYGNYALLYGAGQTIYGVYRYFIYSNKIRKYS